MNPIVFFYNEFLWRPLFNGLVFFYTILPGEDVGLAIIALTLTIRFLTMPLLQQTKKSQNSLAKIQPKIKKIQEQFKSNKEAQSRALMELYARERVNPFSGCLVILIQIPVLLALFQVFQQGFDPQHLSFLYAFVVNPGHIDPVSFGILDLSKGNIYLGVVAAVTQFVQTKLTGTVSPLTSEKSDFSRALQWQTLYVFPAIILLWSYTLPSALTLYWTVLNLFGIVQEFLTKKYLTSDI